MNQWKDIVGYEGTYSINNMGEVLSVKRNIILKTGDNLGYKFVNLYKDKKNHIFYVHRLVATYFLTKKSSLQTDVNHKNGNKSDNRVENLEWCTKSENLKEWANDNNVREYLKGIGSKGGLATKNKYGKEHYQKLAANMNKKLGRGKK